MSVPDAVDDFNVNRKVSNLAQLFAEQVSIPPTPAPNDTCEAAPILVGVGRPFRGCAGQRVSLILDYYDFSGVSNSIRNFPHFGFLMRFADHGG